MCTASWTHEDDGYRLYFNRDEKLSRQSAMPPRLAERDAVAYLAPVDPDSGGTWIATNEFGLSLCLLNGANLTGRHGVDSETARSRGVVIPELISSRSVASVIERVGLADLSGFAPFTLAALEPGERAGLIEWDGRLTTNCFADARFFMVTSSSFETDAVRWSRQQRFRELTSSRLTVDRELLVGFHQSHFPARGAYGTCMHRSDAETVSFCQIQVCAGEIRFSYSAGAPCGHADAVEQRLPRAGN